MSESDATRLFAEIRAINVRLDHIEQKFDEAANGGGFRRCSSHSVRLKHVENSVELSHARISKVKSWVIGVLIAIAGAAAKYAWTLLESSVKR